MFVIILGYDVDLGEENKTVTNKHTLCYSELVNNVSNLPTTQNIVNLMNVATSESVWHLVLFNWFFHLIICIIMHVCVLCSCRDVLHFVMFF